MKQIDNFQTFEVEVAQHKRVLVYFTASWCGPCSSFSPVMDKASVAFDNMVKTLKVDVDQVPEAAGAFSVRSVPTLILLEDGVPVEGQVGAQSFEQVSNWLMPHVLVY